MKDNNTLSLGAINIHPWVLSLRHCKLTDSRWPGCWYACQGVLESNTRT
jgi:hypothetical protein